MSTAADSYDPKYALWFSADAIRDHFDGDGRYGEIIENLTDDELRAIGLDALQTDELYDVFHRALMWELVDRGLVPEEDM